MITRKKTLTIAEHQEITYEIVYMIDDFCKKHNIKYMLYGGSLLGAIRHDGIIPWDDDADLAMVREDYDRFITLFQEERPIGYQLLSIETTPGYRIPLIKVTKNNTFFEHNGICDMDMGIWVDILPIDGCPGMIDDAQKYFINLHKQIDEYVLFDTRSLKGKILAEIREKGTIPLQQKERRRVFMQLLNQVKSNSVSECKYAACIVNGLYGKGEVQERDFYNNLETHRFGTKDIPIPKDWDKYLTDIYGDYMKLPPEEKRKHHSKYTSFIIETESEETDYTFDNNNDKNRTTSYLNCPNNL